MIRLLTIAESIVLYDYHGDHVESRLKMGKSYHKCAVDSPPTLPFPVLCRGSKFADSSG